MAGDPTATKYIIKASISADGIIEKPDVIGAIFGQTEGLLGNEMDLRDLQKGARIGRIEVNLDNKGGKSTGTIELPSAMDKVESAIMAAALETIDRVGPAKAAIKVLKIEDARGSKRDQVMARAKELLAGLNDDPGQDSGKISDAVRNAVQVADIKKYKGLWAGPNIESSDSVIVVEGRSDVLNLLKYGIRNAIAVGGTGVPDVIVQLSKEKTTILFVDGDRGGELNARSLIEACEVDFVARAPQTREVEELPHKLVMKCLQNKLTRDQYIAQSGIAIKGKTPAKADAKGDDEGDKKPARRRRGRGRGKKSEDGEEKPAKTESKDEEGDKKPARGRRPAAKKDDEKPAKKAPAKKPAAKKAPAKKSNDPRAGLGDNLSGLAGSLKANLLDDTGSSIKEGLPVRELADTLKGSKDAVHTVVFDGVITQRLLDIAADKKISTVVGVKMGNVSKVPDAVEILTKDDLA
ncbi:MAG: DNA primase DnaG [Thermoplasmatota archaeon]